MADDIDEQVTVHIREILRLVPDVKGRILRNLNEPVEQTSKFELQSTTDVQPKVIMVQSYHVEIHQGETSSLPIYLFICQPGNSSFPIAISSRRSSCKCHCSMLNNIERCEFSTFQYNILLDSFLNTSNIPKNS